MESFAAVRLVKFLLKQPEDVDMRNELATMTISQARQIADAPAPRLLSISWNDYKAGEDSNSEVAVQPTRATRATKLHPAFDYTPRPEAWGINE